jgi:hypothetical protein
MARQSAAARQIAQVASVTSIDRIRRLRTPAELNDEQRAEFRRVVDEMPAEWFAPAHVMGLVQYCRHVAAAKRVAQLIDEMLLQPVIDKDELASLYKAQEAESRIIIRLMTALRITPQSIECSRVSPLKLQKPDKNNPWSDD